MEDEKITFEDETSLEEENEKITKEDFVEEKDTEQKDKEPKKLGKAPITAGGWIAITLSIIIVGSVVGWSIDYYNKQKANAEAIANHSYASNDTTGTTSTMATTTQRTYSDEELASMYVDPDDKSNTGIVGTTSMVNEYYSVDEAGNVFEVYEGEIPYSTGIEETTSPVGFNPQIDANANSSLLNYTTISVDGIMLDFPITFESISSKFNLVNSKTSTTVTADTIIDRTITLTTKAKTGVGTISFTFSSEGTPKELSKCKCTQIKLESHIYDDPEQKNMSLALPGGVNFGDSYETVKDKFPYVANNHDNNYPAYSIVYTEDNVSYYFLGQIGLTQIIIEF